jgi:clan AA aspartic protease (TIGR02281 family)
VKTAARILAVMVASLATTAAAETYRWTDAGGTTHFTDNESRAIVQGASAIAPQARVSRGEPAQAQLATRLLGDAPEVRIPFVREGNLIRLRVKLNNRIEVPFYLDTGSSGVVIPRSFAKRLSLEVGPSSPTVVLHTSGGPIQVPAVQLESVQLGGAEIENLEASVSPNLEIGLLGGAFFNNFTYSIDPVSQVVVLRRVSFPQ